MGGGKNAKGVLAGGLSLGLILVALLIMSPYFGWSPSVTEESWPIELTGESYLLKIFPHRVALEGNTWKGSYELSTGEKIMDQALGDVDGDQQEELLLLIGEETSPYGHRLAVLTLEVGKGLREMSSTALTEIKPWMLSLCDLEGDGEKEIFLGVYKGTRLDPELKNRPFFFNYRGGGLVKKWTGSRLENPFHHVSFMDLHGVGKDDMVVIEKLGDGKERLAIYYWFGFGFILQGESPPYEAIRRVMPTQEGEPGLLSAEVKVKRRWEQVFFSLGALNEAGVYQLEEVE